MTDLTASGFSGRGYVVLYADGTIRSFGNAPPFSSVNASSALVSMAMHPSGQGLAVLEANGNIHFRGTAANLGNVSSDNNFVDLVYNHAGDGLWALDDQCNCHHLGNCSGIDRDQSQGNVIRLSMSSDTAGKVIDSHGHLYTVDTTKDSKDGVNFDNGAVGGGYSGSNMIIATDHSEVKTLTWSGSTGTLTDYYPSATGAKSGSTVLGTNRFNVMDIAMTPGHNGYWLLVNFRSTFNLHDQFTVIGVGDARPAGGTDPASVQPYDANHDPVDPVRIVPMPALSSGVPDLYLDALYLPTLYSGQGGGSYNESSTGYQSMHFYDLGSEYRLYVPMYATQWSGSTPTGLSVVLPLQHVRNDAVDDLLALELTFTWSGGVWRLTEGQYAYYQGSSTPHSELVDVLNDVSDLIESLEAELVELDVMSEGTLTPVLVALDALVVAVKIYNLYAKLANLLDDGGRANFPAVAAHAIVRASNSLGPASVPDLASQVPVFDSSAFASTLATSAHTSTSGFSAAGTPGDTTANFDVTVDSNGNLGQGTTQITFRVWGPEQSIAHNSGGCVVSSKIDIVENNGLDAHCAFLCFFALAQGSDGSDGTVSQLTLVAAAGGVEWISLLGDSDDVDTAIGPCILGGSDPTNSSRTLGSTSDILNAVAAQIRTGAQNQSNCDEDVGYGLANFVVDAMRSFITTLGAV
ncbi:MAG TPA: hypothetical protein VFS20_31225 [Longimicrobium sp.]|nr:hypothetical protein [Longimicrobium sp.]